MNNATKTLLKELVKTDPGILEFLGNDNPSIYTAWDLSEFKAYSYYRKGVAHLEPRKSQGMS